MTHRSQRGDVRNPMMALPEMTELKAVLAEHPEVREAADKLLLALQRDTRERASKAWYTHKAPMAAYWKAWSVNWGHLRRAIR